MRPRTGLHVVHWLAAAALVLSPANGFTAGPSSLYPIPAAAMQRMPSAGRCLDKRQVAMMLHKPRRENLVPDARPSKDKMSRLSFLASIPATVASVALVSGNKSTHLRCG